MRKHNTITIITTILALAGLWSCQEREVADENIAAYSFTAAVETVSEGNDIPVHLAFSDGGLVVDNESWGDKWKSAEFYGKLFDARGREVENAVFSGPEGVITNGSTLGLSKNGRTDIVIGALREGEYTLSVNLRTRYTVDTWATAAFSVLKKSQGGTPAEDETVLVDDITVPGADNGLEIDDIGNIVLDLKYYNASNPFRFRCTVRPANATNKQLRASSGTQDVADAAIDGQTLLVIVPKSIGRSTVTVRSEDGNAEKSFGVTVIRSADEPTGFTLPTDDGERDAFGFDIAGRLELDIDAWNESNPFDYECKAIPATASKPALVASSDNEPVLEAAIRDGNKLRLTPKSPGYATVTVSTTDGKIVRKMSVVVFSKISLVIDALESEPSEEDKEHGIFPCELTIKTSSKWTPKMFQVEVFGKAMGRIDLTDSADSFKVDSLKNARTAYFSVQEKVPVLYLSNGNSAYDVYTRLMKKVASMGAVVHHSADWPHYKDYIVYFRLYKIFLNISAIENYDTNVYRVAIDERYDSPDNRIYQYLY